MTRLFNAGRDTYLVRNIIDLHSKLDNISRMVSGLLANGRNIPRRTVLPRDITLPVVNRSDLDKVEDAIDKSSSLKDCMVRICLPVLVNSFKLLCFLVL